GIVLDWTEPNLEVCGGGGGTNNGGANGTASHGGTPGSRSGPSGDAVNGGGSGAAGNSAGSGNGGDGLFVLVVRSDDVIVEVAARPFTWRRSASALSLPLPSSLRAINPSRGRSSSALKIRSGSDGPIRTACSSRL